jgi:hypothetical protein
MQLLWVVADRRLTQTPDPPELPQDRKVIPEPNQFLRHLLPLVVALAVEPIQHPLKMR